jgi:hypothetical protein
MLEKIWQTIEEFKARLQWKLQTQNRIAGPEHSIRRFLKREMAKGKWTQRCAPREFFTSPQNLEVQKQ